MAGTVPRGWYADPSMPWVAWLWDGTAWTGDAYRAGRRGRSPRPAAPPSFEHRVEVVAVDTAGVDVPAGIVPALLGLVGLVLLLRPLLTAPSTASGIGPVPIVAAGVALLAVLHGTVLFSVEWARRRAEARRAFASAFIRPPGSRRPGAEDVTV